MSDYKGRLRLRINDKKLTFDLLKSVAVDIYEHVRKSDQFPYDENQKRSRDKRKIWGSPWHLRSMGAAFVGGDKVAGHFYKGDAQTGNKDMITIVFTNIKRMKSGEDFDYATAPNAGTGKPLLPTGTTRRSWSKYVSSADIDRFIDKAIDEYWDKL